MCGDQVIDDVKYLTIIFRPSQTIIVYVEIFLFSNRMKIRLEMFLG